MDCSVKSSLEWYDAGFVYDALWLGVMLLSAMHASVFRAKPLPMHRARYLLIAFVLFTGLAPAMIWGSFDVVHCLPYRSYHSQLMLLGIAFPALAWFSVLSWAGRILLAMLTLAILVLFATKLDDHAGIVIPSTLAVASFAWWHVLPLLKQESDDFSGRPDDA